MANPTKSPPSSPLATGQASSTSITITIIATQFHRKLPRLDGKHVLKVAGKPLVAPGLLDAHLIRPKTFSIARSEPGIIPTVAAHRRNPSSSPGSATTARQHRFCSSLLSSASLLLFLSEGDSCGGIGGSGVNFGFVAERGLIHGRLKMMVLVGHYLFANCCQDGLKLPLCPSHDQHMLSFNR